ncbi:hypothetical protein NKK52_12085 [Mesorhizobium sp. C277A]|uniref:hypothetical protein n=1 Tax=unclassified Mesorhizobium TaxID=325217 RepID=UPI0004193F93|nr:MULTISPECIES: hypothetical protein [unclassified Mesorhizobium]
MARRLQLAGASVGHCRATTELEFLMSAATLGWRRKAPRSTASTAANLPQKQQHPPREEVRRVSFLGPILGRRWGSAVFAIAGEEVGFDEILFAGSREAKSLEEELRSL